MFGVGRLGTLGCNGNPFYWVLPGASIDMNFATGQYYGKQPSDLTVSRNLVAYSDNTAGVWSSFAINTPRITDKGLLVEEQRANSIRNNSMQGAVAGIVGSGGSLPSSGWFVSVSGGVTGVTTEVISVGTDDGIDRIRIKFSGTPSGNATVSLGTDSTTAEDAATGESWAGSIFHALVSGSSTSGTGSFILRSNEYTAVGAFVTNNDGSISTPTTASLSSQRQSYVRTLNGGGTVAKTLLAWCFNVSSGVAFDLTVDIGWPQNERNAAFVTSPIPTTSAAVTRPIDFITITSPPTFGSDLSIFNSWNAETNTGAPQICTDIRVDGTNRIRLDAASGGNALGYSASTGGASAGGLINLGAMAANTNYKAAIAFSLNNLRGAMSGTLATADTSADIPVGIATASVGLGGSAVGGAPLNGYLKRFALWPTTAITNGTLQSITT